MRLPVHVAEAEVIAEFASERLVDFLDGDEQHRCFGDTAPKPRSGMIVDTTTVAGRPPIALTSDDGGVMLHLAAAQGNVCGHDVIGRHHVGMAHSDQQVCEIAADGSEIRS